MKSWATLLINAAAGLVVLATPPADARQMAYVGPGAPDPTTKVSEAGERAGRIRADFARCVYKRHPRKVDALLSASDPVTINFTSLGYDSAGMMGALDMPSCMAGFARGNDALVQFRMDQRALRAMLAEAAYLARYPVAPGLLDALPFVNRRFIGSESALVAARASADFADCLVRAAPHESDSFLRTTQGSAAEVEAVKGLAPAIPRCVAAGQTVRINKVALREFVADGLWATSTATPEKK